MKKDTKVSKFINEYVKANHIMEVSTLSDKLDRIDFTITDKENKPYDVIIGNATNNVRYERGQDCHKIYENKIVAHGTQNSDRAINVLEKSLAKLIASTKDIDKLSLYDLVLSGDKYYMTKISFGDRVLYCMGTKQNLDENLKTMQNVCEVEDYTLCSVANHYIVTRLLKALSTRKDFKIFADTNERRISFTVSEASYNFILGQDAFNEILAIALAKHLLIRPFHKGGRIIEQF